jgi:D-proline reductase (dithiol) PrdB
MKVAYIDRLNEHYQSQGFPAYTWSQNDQAPWTEMVKPLSEARVSMLTSGGVSCSWQPPFDPQARNDLRVLDIPKDAPADGFVINDSYYDHRDADSDINCVFPIERMRELEADGTIGELSPRLFSGFMGRIYTRTAVLEEAAPALVAKLREDHVDALVLVPA